LEWAFASRRIDIARLLLERGSRVDHISAKGWTPAFNLFGYDYMHEKKQPSCVEYLQLLSAAGFSDWDIQDVAGWTAMHRAAFHGKSEDISALVNVGASATITNNWDEKPIKLALKRNNIDAFQELAKYLPPSFINEQDKRGWTLLHEAALTCSLEMLNLIFQYDPDPHILTFRTSFDVPNGLEQKALTPADIARHQGEDHFRNFAKALSLAGHDIAVDLDSKEDEADDLFWLASSEKF
jgi:ankyrin repeat protein